LSLPSFPTPSELIFCAASKPLKYDALGNADLIVTGDKDLLSLTTFLPLASSPQGSMLDLAQPQHAR
jgi:hypothetical protein